MNELFTRVSVRDFIPGKVEKDKVDRILEAAMNAPSARNQQAWEFIVVDDPDYIRELSKVTPYAGPVGKAPLAIVVLGNRDLMSAPQFWEQDLGACTENLMLSATSLGLGSVWIGVAPVRERMNAISDIFDLTENLMPFCIVAVGYPKETIQTGPVRPPGPGLPSSHFNDMCLATIIPLNAVRPSRWRSAPAPEASGRSRRCSA